MNRQKRVNLPYLVISALVLIVLLFSAPQTVQAQGIVRGDDLPAGITLDGDGIFFGSKITIDGDVDGDVLAIGSTVEINGNVSGSLVVIGQKISIAGEVAGTTYGGAIELALAPTANLARNLYFAGVSLITQEGSQINRDLYAATLGAQMGGAVGGDIKAIIGPVEFFNLFVDWLEKSNMLPKDLFPDLFNPTDAQTRGYQTALTLPGVRVASMGMFSIQPVLNFLKNAPLQQPVSINWASVGGWFLERAHELLVLFVFGLLSLWLLPRYFPGSAKALRTKPLPAIGWGLLGLVISFNLTGVIALLAAVIAAIGVFLIMVTFWELALPFMVISGFSLGLASTVFALYVIYTSKALMAYFVGRLILDRFSADGSWKNALALLIGLVIYVFLAAIPILGWVIGLIVTALGLGASWLYYRSTRTRTATGNEVEASPEVEAGSVEEEQASAAEVEEQSVDLE